MNIEKHIDKMLDLVEDDKPSQISTNMIESKTVVPTTVDEDKKNIKKTLYDLSDKGMNQLAFVGEIIREIPDPRMVDSYAKLMKSVADINMNILKLDKSKEPKKEIAKTINNTQNNYGMTTSELKEKLNKKI